MKRFVAWFILCLSRAPFTGGIPGYWSWLLGIITIATAVLNADISRNIPKLLRAGLSATAADFTLWGVVFLFGLGLLTLGYIWFGRAVAAGGTPWSEKQPSREERSPGAIDTPRIGDADSTKNDLAAEQASLRDVSEAKPTPSGRRLSWNRLILMGGLAIAYLYLTGFSPVGAFLAFVGTPVVAFSARTPFKWTRANLVGGLGLMFLIFFPIHQNASVLGLAALVAMVVMLVGTYD